jgi:hypothetical protein
VKIILFVADMALVLNKGGKSLKIFGVVLSSPRVVILPSRSSEVSANFLVSILKM